MKSKNQQLTAQIRAILLFFIVALVLSGATAIPVQSEIRFLLNHISGDSFFYHWLYLVYEALDYTVNHYPFLLYGYDWLAFAHFVIAIAFFGPFKNPVRNIWVIEFGMIACLLILPYSFMFCVLRGIPLWWALIDCSFGVFGFLPLWICRNKIQELEKLAEEDKLNVVF